MRSLFQASSRIHWHPGHQKLALRQLRDGIHHVDMVIEVRDARIPLSSANPQFEEVLGRRDRLIVLNKTDLANHNMRKPVIDAFAKHSNTPVLFTSTQRPQTIKTIIDFALEKALSDPQRYSFLSLVVVGAPNVGKSSLINAMRHVGVKKGKTSTVASHAGVTRTIQTRVKIYENPPIYLVDTPGILDPQIKNAIQGLRLALAGCTKDSLTDEIEVADYLLFRLNQSPVCTKNYTNLLNLETPTDNIDELLTKVIQWSKSRLSSSSTYPNTRPPIIPDKTAAARYLIRKFREGDFGPLTLDDCSSEGLESWFQENGAHTSGSDSGSKNGDDSSLLKSSSGVVRFYEGLRGKLIKQSSLDTEK
ncbi:Mitochondrial GTPase [Blyttiomyces sp. JEL0837]|nr:Mitochondrial GTPase [Blyttiomyces sp. JEL0837]